MNASCIFCKIVAGAVPCARLYEDEDVLAFLDIGPIVPGHALVIPKSHHEHLTQLPVTLLGQVMAVAQRIAAAQMAGLGADGVNLHQSNGACAGQVVPHMHVHVIPRFNRDGHRWNWASKSYASQEEMNARAEAIRTALEGRPPRTPAS